MSTHYEEFYVHSWTIKDFEQLFVDDERFAYSDSFISPIIINNQTCDKPLNNYKWRLKIKFKRYEGALGPYLKKDKEFIGLFLVSYKGNYESENNLSSREMIWKFDVDRIEENNDITSLSCDNNVMRYTFKFDGRNSSGNKSFCQMSSIFENHDYSKKTDLIFRVHFLIEKRNGEELASCNSCLTPSMDYFLNNNLYYDIVFKFDCGSEIKASRLILALKSSYFKRMFESEFLESKSSIIHIKNVKYECFKLIIDYVYTNKLEKGLSFEILKDLYVEADIRDLKLLKELVCSQITSLLNNDNLDRILLMALQTCDEGLKKIVFSYIRSNFVHNMDCCNL